MDKRIASARTACLERLRVIEVALSELREPDYSRASKAAIEPGAEFRLKLEARVLHAALALRHLEDDYKRLAKRIDGKQASAAEALEAAQAISLIRRLADSWKHGLGGQSKNSTHINGVVVVVPRGLKPEDEQEGAVVGVGIADATLGFVVSSTAFRYGVLEWRSLADHLRPEIDEWAARLEPPTDKPVIELTEDGSTDLPVGAVAALSLNPKLIDTMRREAKRRSESA